MRTFLCQQCGEPPTLRERFGPVTLHCAWYVCSTGCENPLRAVVDLVERREGTIACAEAAWNADQADWYTLLRNAHGSEAGWQQRVWDGVRRRRRLAVVGWCAALVVVGVTLGYAAAVALGL